MSDYSDLSSDDEEIHFRAPRVFHDRRNYFTELTEEQFKMRFRLRKHTVQYLEQRLHAALLKPTRRNQPLSPMFMILLTLRFYATGTFQMVIGDLFKIDRGTASRTIHRVTAAIAELRPEFIKMPATQNEMRKTMRDFYQIRHFPGVIGAVDCTHIPIRSPGGNNAEVFRNRHGWFSLNVQAICDSELRCLNIVARWPGSAHDSNIFDNSRIHAQFEAREIPEGVLLGDSAYRCCRYLLTPILHEQDPAERAYNRAHRCSRSTIERTFGVVKRRFPCLSMGLRVKLLRVPPIIVATFILHNIALNANEEIPDVDEGIVPRGIYQELPVPAENQRDRRENTAVRTALINNTFRR